MPPVLPIPTDRPRPSVPSYQGDIEFFIVPARVAARLRALAHTENATLYMVLLAAFKVLLARYTGQTDVVVGAPIANRRRAELERLIGIFANTLVLRSD
jgi:non-ribosomal peptide synthetase component F